MHRADVQGVSEVRLQSSSTVYFERHVRYLFCGRFLFVQECLIIESLLTITVKINVKPEKKIYSEESVIVTDRNNIITIFFFIFYCESRPA